MDRTSSTNYVRLSPWEPCDSGLCRQSQNRHCNWSTLEICVFMKGHEGDPITPEEGVFTTPSNKYIPKVSVSWWNESTQGKYIPLLVSVTGICTDTFPGQGAYPVKILDLALKSDKQITNERGIVGKRPMIIRRIEFCLLLDYFRRDRDLLERKCPLPPPCQSLVISTSDFDCGLTQPGRIP